ncbi:MAG: hypothetical protein J7L15_01035 [Clostridiales bacterium]|nr:hypothetical protein [Clostridiales bacterium]
MIKDERYLRETDTKYLGLIEDGEDIWYIEHCWDIAKDGHHFNERLVAADDSFIVRHTHRMDDCFSLDENLQNFVEKAKLIREN